jgi:hypothetical protein
MWKSKSQIDEHLQVYYEEQIEKKDKQIEVEYELKRAKFEQQIAKEWAEYEHTYHKGMENRKVVLAKLDAQIEHKQELLKVYDGLKNDLIKEKSETIKQLLSVIEMLAPSYEQTEDEDTNG